MNMPSSRGNELITDINTKKVALIISNDKLRCFK